MRGTKQRSGWYRKRDQVGWVRGKSYLHAKRLKVGKKEPIIFPLRILSFFWGKLVTEISSANGWFKAI